MRTFLHDNFHPLVTAFTFRPLPFKYRWRLLVLFPLNILTNIIIKAPFFFSRKPYTTIHIPTRSGPKRALLYHPPPPASTSKQIPEPSPDDDTTAPLLRPIHLSLHPGAFIGGLPESQRRLDTLISQRTGAIVISPTYRFAPLHPYPAAIDDIDDIISWLHTHAASLFGGNPNLITTGGTSAGGNLALAACHGEGCAGGSEADTRVKGTYTCYAPIELRVPPWEKKILCPEKYPKRDPLACLQELYNCYAELSGGRSGEARCSPVVMEWMVVPRDLLVVLAEIDVVVDEERRFVERVRDEVEQEGGGDEEGERLVGEGKVPRGERERRVELMEVEGAFHGWLELPRSILEEKRLMVYERIVGFLGEVHRRYGFEIPE